MDNTSLANSSDFYFFENKPLVYNLYDQHQIKLYNGFIIDCSFFIF